MIVPHTSLRLIKRTDSKSEGQNKKIDEQFDSETCHNFKIKCEC